MKQAVLGALAGAGLVMAAVGLIGQRGVARAQRLTPHWAGPPNEVIAVPTPVRDNGQLLTVIEPRQQVMSVYHIDLDTGKIRLCSVRNIHWDLQMTEFNGESPLPREIQTLLEQR